MIVPATLVSVAGSSASVAPRTPKARLLQSNTGQTIHVRPSAVGAPKKTHALTSDVARTHASRCDQYFGERGSGSPAPQASASGVTTSTPPMLPIDQRSHVPA